MIKLPKDFIAAGYKFDAGILSPKFETAMTPDGSTVFRAGYETNEVEEFAQNFARKITERVDAAIIDELLRLNGYVPEKTCKRKHVTYTASGRIREFLTCGHVFEHSCSGEVIYCPYCGAKVTGYVL